MGRLSQELVEVAIVPTPKAQISNLIGEVAVTVPQVARLSSVGMEVAVEPLARGVLSQLFLEVIFSPAPVPPVAGVWAQEMLKVKSNVQGQRLIARRGQL